MSENKIYIILSIVLYWAVLSIFLTSFISDPALGTKGRYNFSFNDSEFTEYFNNSIGGGSSGLSQAWSYFKVLRGMFSFSIPEISPAVNAFITLINWLLTIILGLMFAFFLRGI